MRMRDEMIEDRGTGEGERREEGRRKRKPLHGNVWVIAIILINLT